jgi:amino acid adenylation domain-containing protein
MRVEHFLSDSTSRNPDKVAIIAGSVRLTYAELNDRSSALAAALQAGGTKRNDRVLVFMDNAPEAAIAIFAVLKAGATFSPINASTKPDKLAYVVDNCRPSAILTQHKLAPVASEAIAGRNVTVLAAGTLEWDNALAMSSPVAPHGGIDVDLAMLVYTSGSTGRPKGVMMTHRNVDAASDSIITYLGTTSDDVILNVAPLAFDYGLYQLLMAVRLGATLVLEKSFAFPASVFETMRREKVTGLPLVPTIAAMILQIRDASILDVPSLRYITNTAAALPEAHVRDLRALFPHATLFSMYGLTECKRCTYLPPAELDRRPGSVGIAIPNTEAYVADEAGNPIESCVIGELVIRGPHVMQGYWEDPHATAQRIRPGRNGWEKVLFTGDLFYADAEGFLYFVGRKDDIIKTRGEKVAPKEVEAVLYAHPAVAEAIVVGVADPVLGQAVKAIVVLSDPTATEADILRHCTKRLEDFMVPKSIEFRSSLPKTDTGKVSRRLAAELLDLS